MSGKSRINVGFDEIVAMKNAQQKLPGLLVRLREGDLRHIIITRRGAPVGVVLSIERYEQLLDGAGPEPHPALGPDPGIVPEPEEGDRGQD